MQTRHSTALQRAFDWLARDPEKTLALAEQALEVGEETAAWLTAKGLALSALREPERAAKIYRELIALEPDVAEHHTNLGNALIELSHISAAREALERAQTLGAADGNLYFALAKTSLQGGEPRRALAEVVSALKLGLDQDIEVALLYLRVLIALDEMDLAKDNVKRLMPAPMAPELACEFALLILQLSDYAGAEQAALKVDAKSPDYPMALISLGLAFERSNQMHKLQQVRTQLSDLLPEFSSHASVSDLLQTRTGQSLIQLDARIAARGKDHRRVHELLHALLAHGALESGHEIAIRFELARTLDLLGQPDAAMAELQIAHGLSFARVAAAHPKMAFEDDPLHLLSKPFRAITASPTPVDTYNDPVFVVGFPRSGTTLLEQLLDAHPKLQSFDEQPFLQKCLLRMQQLGKQYPTDLGLLTANEISVLRVDYFERCRLQSPGLAADARYVDKNPLNLARLPLIQALFPHAKVIVILRHPMDCVLSCYQQHFRAPAFAVAMKTLQDTAQMYHRVFHFYHQIRPSIRLDMLELKYEDFVRDTPKHSHQLFEFLNLPWNENLLGFTERAKTRAISTPSYAAVTETVYTRAVGKNRQYDRHFSESGAKTILTPWLETLQYQNSENI